MKALVVKLSSMGDVIHAMPALSDAARALPGLRFDWVVEEAFAPLCAAHPAVRTTIPVALRRWRAGGASPRQGLGGFLAAVRAQRYDRVIDAQGLYKSVMVASLARGPRHGFGWRSAREPLASLLYGHRHRVPRSLHAVARQRALFAAAFGYPLPADAPDYGLSPQDFPDVDLPAPYLVFAHGTTWTDKQWPVEAWQALARSAAQAGFAVGVMAQGAAERARAESIAGGAPNVRLLPPLDLRHAAGAIGRAAGVVAVDTGLGHLAAAFGVPSVSLYGPTAPALTGTLGPNQRHLAGQLPCVPCLSRTCRLISDRRAPAPCLAGISPGAVWDALAPLLGGVAIRRLAP